MKRRLGLTTRNVLFKFVLSFMLVFLLPLLMLGFIIYRDSYVSLKTTLERSALDQIEQLRGYGDARVREIRYVMTRIRSDYSLQQYVILEGPLAQMRAIDRLNLYKTDDATVKEILLYLHDQDLLFTSRGIIRLSALADSAFRTVDERESFLRLIRDTTVSNIRPTGPVYLDDNTPSDIMMFLFPLPDNAETPRATLLFFIPKSGFETMIRGLLLQTSGQGGILDPDGNLLAGFGQNTLDKEVLRTIASLPRDRAMTPLRIGGDKFTFIQARSERNDWTYWALLPESAFYQPVIRKQTGLLILGVGLFVLGMLLIFSLSFLHYRPVNRFMQAIRTYLPETKRSKPVIDWKEIEENLSALETRKTFTRRQLVENLLLGRESYDPQRHYIASGLLLDHACTAVALFRLVRPEGALTSAEMQEALEMLEERADPPGLRCYYTGMEQLSEFALLLNSSDSDPQRIERTLEEIRETLRFKKLESSVGFGSWQPSADGIHRSYVEASAALDYARNGSNREDAVAFGDMKTVSAPDVEWFPVKEQLRYLQSLKQGDTTEAAASLRAIISTLQEHASSLLLSKYVCLDLITQIIRTLQQEKLKYHPEDLHQLLQFNNLNTLADMLETMTVQICTEVAQRKSHQHSALTAQIVEFLEREFANPILSLDWTADWFQVSPSYVSRLVKEQTGTNFAQLLSELRLREAKRLLAETNYAIHEIVAKIGYIDPKSFMRKFKTEVGLTLGDYRKLHKLPDPNERLGDGGA